MKKYQGIILMGLLGVLELSAMQEQCWVRVPVASVWTEPTDFDRACRQLPFLSSDIPIHETQVLFGEQLDIMEVGQNGWLRVALGDQREFYQDRQEWDLCQGWIESADTQELSMVSQFMLAMFEPNLVVSSG